MFIAIALPAQTEMQQLGSHTFDDIVNEVWGYHSNGKEYALVGVQNGFWIIDVTDPENTEELFYWERTINYWCDIKVWDNFAYVVSETPLDGMLIVDLSDLPNSAESIVTDLGGYYHTAHNIFIDENGYLYLAGYSCNDDLISSDNQSGVSIFSLSFPWVPLFKGVYSGGYCHDVYVRNDMMYTSEIYEGRMGIVDITDKANPIQMGTINTPYSFTHSISLSDNSQYAFTADEKTGAYIASYDVTNPNDIIHLDSWRESEENIPHNTHVINDFQVISYYKAGVQIVDSHEPDLMARTEYFTPTTELGFWGVYPYLPSGNILATDRDGILYILKATYKRACYLRGNITNAHTGNTIYAAQVAINQTGINATSGFNGNYGLSQVDEGVFTVNVAAEGYRAKSVEVELESGEVVMKDFELKPAQKLNTSIVLKNAVTGDLIANGQVNIDYFSQNYTVEATNGNVFLEDIFRGFYTITAGAWGYESTQTQQQIVDSEPIIIELQPGYTDEFLFDFNWETFSDCEGNTWEINVEANDVCDNLTGYLACELEDDIQSDFGESFTYFGTSAQFPNNTGINCYAKLKSPVINFSNFNEALVSFAYSTGLSHYGAIDFAGEVRFGIEWGDGEQFFFDSFNYSQFPWKHKYYNLKNLMDEVPDEAYFIVELTSNGIINVAKIQFAIDDFKVREANTVIVGINEAINENGLEILGNPFSESFGLQISKNTQTGIVDIYNANGQLIQSEEFFSNQRYQLGGGWGSGIYYIHLLANSKREISKVVKY